MMMIGDSLSGFHFNGFISKRYGIEGPVKNHINNTDIQWKNIHIISVFSHRNR